MAVKQIAPKLFAVPLGFVNAFLIDADELILVDTGNRGDEGTILEAIREIGRKPSDLKHILVTHCHPDHAGSLAELKEATGASAYMHPIDAAITRTGKVAPDLKPSPGLLNNILFNRFIGFEGSEYSPAEIEYEVNDGDELPIAGGLRAMHVPGHSAGQLAFFWNEYGGVLFAADTAGNTMRLGYSLGYADFEEGKRSLAKLAKLDFEVACFGHGKAIESGASNKFKKKWGSS